MSEIEAMIKTLRYAGYEVITRREAMELEAKLDKALEQVKQLQIANDNLRSALANLEHYVEKMGGW